MKLGLALLLLTGCTDAPTGASITLGAVLSLTGELANIGADEARAMQLAIDEINEAGGVTGSHLILEIADDATMSDRSPMQAAALINEKMVPVIFGAIGSSATLKTADVTVPAKVVQITGSSTSPAITTYADQGYLFRTCASAANQGKLAAQRAKDKGFTKVAIIHEPEAYGIGVASTFETAFKAGGGTITSNSPYVPKQPSYMTLLTNTYAGDPEAILLIGYPDSGVQIIKDYNTAFAVRGTYWFFTDALDDLAFIEGVGGAGFAFMHEGTRPATPAGPTYEAFKNAFTVKYGQAPGLGAFSPNFYDAVYMVALAIAAGGKSDGTSIRDQLTSVSRSGTKYSPQQFSTAVADAAAGKDIDYEGVSGDVDLDATGEVVAPYDIWKVATNKITIVETNKSP
jgi:branched-chain amino acid transport system substrate-binding protein